MIKNPVFRGMQAYIGLIVGEVQFIRSPRFKQFFLLINIGYRYTSYIRHWVIPSVIACTIGLWIYVILLGL